MSTTKARVFGLDLLRAAAITCVVVCHAVGYFPSAVFGKLTGPGTLGVEIFFVLSGFLIGGILVRLVDRQRFTQPRELLHFWLNRWFRTLPLYYVYLAATFLFSAGHPFVERLRIYELYPFFLQNFAWNIGGTLFSHSWSLAIEEFFYLFFPLILWLLFLVVPQPPRRAFLTVTLLFIGLPLLLRILHGPEADFAAFDASIRKWVIFRLDALMFGVGMAVAKRYYPDFWQAVYRGTPATALLASALLLFLIFGLHLLVVFPFLQLVIFPIISLTVALTLPWADGWKLQPGWAGRLVESISCSSYSTYLAHPMLLILAYRLSHAARHGLPGWLMAPLVAVYMLLGGYLLYLLIEKPLMKLREVWNARFGADARRQPTDTLGAPLKSEV